MERGFIVAAVSHGIKERSQIYMYDSKNKYIETQSNGTHSGEIQVIHSATGDFFATVSRIDELFIWDC
jgi:hypothetical protein